tara:strand:+ start:5670 stop:6227 length:558 start_codon:yes stop_codon:yes gene_type:complete
MGFDDIFNNLSNQVNRIKQRLSESSTSNTYEDQSNELKIINNELDSLQTNIINDNYEDQLHISEISSDINTLQKELSDLEKKYTDLQNNNDTAEKLNDQTFYNVSSTFYFFIGKILILFFLIYMIYNNFTQDGSLIKNIVNNINKTKDNKVTEEPKKSKTPKNVEKKNNKKYNINYNNNNNNNND